MEGLAKLADFAAALEIGRGLFNQRNVLKNQWPQVVGTVVCA
jgi:hypothetical protein